MPNITSTSGGSVPDPKHATASAFYWKAVEADVQAQRKAQPAPNAHLAKSGNEKQVDPKTFQPTMPKPMPASKKGK